MTQQVAVNPHSDSGLSVMIDFETLSLEPNCAVLTMGVAIFNASNVVCSHEFGFSLTQQLEEGRSINSDTLTWHMTKGAKARPSTFSLVSTGGSIAANMQRLVAMVHNREDAESKIFLWGNGANFDPVILEGLLRSCKTRPFWHYRNVRDTRTLFSLCPEELSELPRNHTAMGDAIEQAKAVIRCNDWLRSKLTTTE